MLEIVFSIFNVFPTIRRIHFEQLHLNVNNRFSWQKVNNSTQKFVEWAHHRDTLILVEVDHGEGHQLIQATFSEFNDVSK